MFTTDGIAFQSCGCGCAPIPRIVKAPRVERGATMVLGGAKRKPRNDLTPGQRDRVRSLYGRGLLTMDQLATQYNVAKSTIFRILQSA